jgi:hypothetical protein
METSGVVPSSIRTYTGIYFTPLEPRVEDVRIEDIAHALSQLNRFCGHSRKPYSVAEHSVRAAALVPKEDQLWALLHDAAEIYGINDLAAPLKNTHEFAFYRDVEERIQEVVFERFGLLGDRPESVKLADLTMVSTEARDLMGVADPAAEWHLPPPLERRIVPWSPEVAEIRFLSLFERLYGPAEAIA